MPICKLFHCCHPDPTSQCPAHACVLDDDSDYDLVDAFCQDDKCCGWEIMHKCLSMCCCRIFQQESVRDSCIHPDPEEFFEDLSADNESTDVSTTGSTNVSTDVSTDNDSTDNDSTDNVSIDNQSQCTEVYIDEEFTVNNNNNNNTFQKHAGCGKGVTNRNGISKNCISFINTFKPNIPRDIRRILEDCPHQCWINKFSNGCDLHDTFDDLQDNFKCTHIKKVLRDRKERVEMSAKSAKKARLEI